MSAHADDLRHFYAEHLGETVEVSLASGAAAANAEELPPGRYLVKVRAISGAALLWLRQKAEDENPLRNATAAAPSTPFPLGAGTSAALGEPIATVIVRPGTGVFSGILDAGTATLVLTKVSRNRA